MENRKRIVIIGGIACGPKVAARARRCDPRAQITLVEQGENISVATCGFPYYISGVIDKRSELMRQTPDYFQNVMDVAVLTRTRALAIDRKAKQVEILNLKTNQRSYLEYDKLVLATGSVPVVPDLTGKDLKGVFTLSRIEDAYALRDLVASRQIKRAAVIGAGLIGMEMTEALASQGIEVTVVEALDWVMPALLDFEVAAHVAKHLKEKGVKLLCGQRVSGFEGDEKGRVKKVIAEDTELEAELVLLAIGVKPNIKLAQEAGLSIGETGGIAVNKELQTSDRDIYAGGDCVENVNLITKRRMLAPMGSTANKHGRVIGSNVTGGCETFPSVLGTSIARVFDYTVALVGLNEAQARKAGYEVVTCLIPGNEHANYYPNSRRILVKLTVNKSNNRLLGGQVVGPGEAAKRIDVLATAITFGATIDDLANLDLAYAPPYNNAMDPLHNAANVIRNKQLGLARALTPAEVKNKLEAGEDFLFLDVRNPEEWQTVRIEAPQVKLLPLPELRTRLNELPKDKEIVIFCQTSIRAYKAQRILDGAGFQNVRFMDGSLVAWPYDISGKAESL